MNNSEPNTSLKPIPSSESIPGPAQDVVEQKVRRAVAVNALHKIGMIVAREQQADTDKVNVLRWALRYGWLILLAAAALLAGLMGVF